MLPKPLIFVSLFVTVLALPDDYSYDDYGYEDNYDYRPPEPDNTQTKFLVEPQNLKTRVGESVIIPCDSTKTSDVLIVKKAGTDKGDLIISVGDMRMVRNPRYSIGDKHVKISDVRKGDAGTYICSYAAQQPVEIRHTLEVESPPKIKVSTEMMLALEGDSITLGCAAEGYPLPSIKWTKQDGRLPSGALEVEGFSLTMTNIDRRVRGSYVCTADNGIGETASGVISVNVEYPPEIITERDIVVGSIGDTVELKCIIDASPAPVIYWSKNGHMLLSDSHIELRELNGLQHSSSPIRHSIIKINQITEDDFGEYICHAENTLGGAKDNISLFGTEMAQSTNMAIVGEIAAGVGGIFLVLLLAFVYRNQGQSYKS